MYDWGQTNYMITIFHVESLSSQRKAKRPLRPGVKFTSCPIFVFST